MVGFAQLPRREDFFPKTKRGHGSQHAYKVVFEDGKVVAEIPNEIQCVDPTCSLNQPKSKNLHTDQKANMQDWCDDRGLSTTHDSPYVAMVKATGGR